MTDAKKPIEENEKFMEFLRGYEPDNPEWWRSEYSGNIKAMYDAWCAGVEWGSNQAARGADGT